MQKSNKNNSKRNKVLKSNKKFEFRKGWLIPIVIVAAGAIFLAWPRNQEGKLTFGNPSVRYEKVSAKDGIVTLPISAFNDYKAKYYVYEFPQKDVLFFVVKSSDGVIRAAYDACDVCFHQKKGYKQEGDLMICNNCGQIFPTDRINVEKGGCNPAPLDRSTNGNNLVLQVSDIFQGARFF